eukprot:m.101242 g.101242  ORF g.101242 m.101242 type:complete len:118 (+) comp12573_c1_seq1:105-458(+)
MSIWDKKFDSSFSVPQVLDLERKKLLSRDGTEGNNGREYHFHDEEDNMGNEDEIDDAKLFDSIEITHDDNPYVHHPSQHDEFNDVAQILGNTIRMNDLYDSDNEDEDSEDVNNTHTY